jgi:SWI/SNF-related matrix-associated actin-dependent regulator of chromatin subfamily A-like protein 1
MLVPGLHQTRKVFNEVMSKSIVLDEQRSLIIISFPYTKGLVAAVKQLSDRTWDNENKQWSVPATMAHARMMRDFSRDYGFSLDSGTLQLAEGDTTRANTRHLTGLKDFQKTAVKFMVAGNGRVICGDEMGLGKTIEAIAYAKSIAASPLLIVCPASVMWKWAAELKKWSSFVPAVIETGKQPLPDNATIIMSYTMMGNRYSQLMKIPWRMIIYDESHYLSNPKSIRTRAAKLVQADHVLMLSGTPFLNRPIELWSILNILDPGTWGNRWSYAMRYCGAYRNYYGWDLSGASNIEELSNRLKGIMIRRTKQDVLSELPDLSRQVIPVSIPLQEYKRELKKLKGKSSTLVALTGLRHLVGMQKVGAAVELAESILVSGNKLVLYAHHKDVVESLAGQLRAYGVVKIVGDLSAEERTKNIARFKEQADVRVMIISSAGGEGIDLYTASDIIFVEREWNPGKEEQAEARLHRIGQQNPVTAYYLMAMGTFDEDIDQVVRSKREIFKGAIGSDDISEEILKNMGY